MFTIWIRNGRPVKTVIGYPHIGPQYDLVTSCYYTTRERGQCYVCLFDISDSGLIFKNGITYYPT